MRRRTGKSIVLAVMTFVLAACSSDSTAPPATSGFDQANAAKGGLSFDTFWASGSGFDQGDARIAAFNARSDFFRCKQCHGWDRLGRAGAYIGRAPTTTRPNVSPVSLASVALTKTPQQLFDAIKSGTGTARRSPTADLSTYNPATNATEGDRMPNFGAIMADAQIWDIVRFLKVDALNVSDLYDAVVTGTYPTGSITFSNLGKDGTAAAGEATFATTCQGCHGVDGRMLFPDGLSLGAFFRAKPNEAHHKVRYGNPGTAMGANPLTLADMKNLYRAMSNATKFPP